MSYSFAVLHSVLMYTHNVLLFRCSPQCINVHTQCPTPLLFSIYRHTMSYSFAVLHWVLMYTHNVLLFRCSPLGINVHTLTAKLLTCQTLDELKVITDINICMHEMPGIIVCDKTLGQIIALLPILIRAESPVSSNQG